MSSRNSFPIIGTSATCCLLVVTFYDPAFLTRPYLDHLLLLGLNCSYKNQQSVPEIILIIINLQSCC
jgi:hypothetical protein